MEDKKIQMNHIKLGKTVKIRLKGIDEVIKVDTEVSSTIQKMIFEKENDMIVTKTSGETISLLQLCVGTSQPLSLEQKVIGDNYSKKNIKINFGDIEYDDDLDGYWACGMLYETVDSAVYVYQAYLDKKANKKAKELGKEQNLQQNLGKDSDKDLDKEFENETLLDYVERCQSEEGAQRVVFIKE